MRRAVLSLVFLISSIFSLQTVFAIDAFVIDNIKVEGLQRISAGTVFNYLPLKVGDRLDDRAVSKSIRELYKTGFFKDVRLEQEGSSLIVFVLERPAIAAIEFDGNKDLDSEELSKALKQIGFAEGRVYDKSLLQRVIEELKRQYYARGKYAVRIDTKVTPLERNRVGIKIEVSEGRVTTIHQINIVGNNAFETEELLDELELTTPTLFSFYTKTDQYAKQKLAGDLEKLRSFYLDRGYINFKIESTQVAITPDKKHIYITVNLSEGDKYVIKEVKLAGDLIIEPKEIFPVVEIKKGQFFSRKYITRTSESIVDLLGKAGYAFSNVNPIPQVDDKTKEVSLTFFVDPGNRVYVRRVNVVGNSNTSDEVIRRELRQFENTWISTTDVERSKQRLQRLGFFKEVSVETPAVPGAADLVDIVYTVEEQSTGSINAGMGFSQSQGVIFNFSVAQANFLGTGNRYAVGANTSDANTLYNFSVTDPYFTDDGISRTWRFTWRETDLEEENLSDYATDNVSFGVGFSVPINEFDRIGFGLDFENTQIDLPGLYIDENGNYYSDTSYDILKFVAEEGDDFNTLRFSANWSHDSRNKTIFPTRGALQRLSGDIVLPGSDLLFYHINYVQQRFFPLSRTTTLMLKGNIGYAGTFDDDAFPPFEKYYAGGMNDVRGYKSNTLGPKDDKNYVLERDGINFTHTATGDPLGGQLKVIANAEVILPVPFVKDSSAYRLSGFFDIGNVFEEAGDFDVGELRYTTGISGAWLSPFGLLRISIAAPLNEEDEDDTETFQFTFGQSF
ncbi:MAG: outer membrane protein assembly factor BamA [gamma proteobacterium symbiont of Lucinoma myriamae]|nr:outer membrane protein assembly factor BamA [gamma proteobacterium symbiont of Lucinoma myriamae]MCU7819555.1 outer membrane protein assembly factor BamA [gamma proteobacterium symbiont of Lucinoma myriamae]MCU7831788.1 outer membrane protein assembly factor BamA [gamma proteobacterium symbiont of Lucinoma myriamae]